MNLLSLIQRPKYFMYPVQLLVYIKTIIRDKYTILCSKYTIINNYSPLATDTEVNSCFSIY